jgi:predicted SnoaL-like aldol condensation-catalyzing enzyme
MIGTTPEQNKALVLEAFDTLFNKRDYDAASRFWSDQYIQHSAHIEHVAKGCSDLSAAFPIACATSTASFWRRATSRDR